MLAENFWLPSERIADQLQIDALRSFAITRIPWTAEFLACTKISGGDLETELNIKHPNAHVNQPKRQTVVRLLA
jgi:hypothetical protein